MASKWKTMSNLTRKNCFNLVPFDSFFGILKTMGTELRTNGFFDSPILDQTIPSKEYLCEVFILFPDRIE